MLLKRIILLSLIISFININTSLAYDIGNEVNEKEYPATYWKNKAPTNATGEINNTAIGNIQLSYKPTKNK